MANKKKTPFYIHYLGIKDGHKSWIGAVKKKKKNCLNKVSRIKRMNDIFSTELWNFFVKHQLTV